MMNFVLKLMQAGPMEPSWQGPKRLDGPWCGMGVRWVCFYALFLFDKC